jgi:hypothetical protein
MVATRYCISFHFENPYLGLNTSKIKHLKFTSRKSNDHEIHPFQPKKPKILENIMDFLPNVSFNSLVVPPTIPPTIPPT